MSELIVVGFDHEDEAERVRRALLDREESHLIDVEDAVAVKRRTDGSLDLDQLHHLTGPGAVSGGFWGLLLGVLFMVPVFGAAVGAATGAVAGALADVGIDDRFIKRLGSTIPPGSSALFLLVRQASPDEVLDELAGLDGRVLRTSLTKEDEETLRRALESVSVERGNDDADTREAQERERRDE